jgi:hypothetical protein
VRESFLALDAGREGRRVEGLSPLRSAGLPCIGEECILGTLSTSPKVAKSPNNSANYSFRQHAWGSHAQLRMHERAGRGGSRSHSLRKADGIVPIPEQLRAPARSKPKPATIDDARNGIKIEIDALVHREGFGDADRFQMLALPSMPSSVTRTDREVKIFCEETEEWEERRLLLRVEGTIDTVDREP